MGLGAGTLASYGRPGDFIRFYEISPAVEQIARSRFTYLSDSPARCEVALGDARLSLEREPAREYDIIALDAFSGDAIPMRLLTREAFAVYLRHLRKNGIIAAHISNKYLNLRPVVRGIAGELNLRTVCINSRGMARD